MKQRAVTSLVSNHDFAEETFTYVESTPGWVLTSSNSVQSIQNRNLVLERTSSSTTDMAKRPVKHSNVSKDKRPPTKEAGDPGIRGSSATAVEKPKSIFATLRDARVQRALQLVLLAALYAPTSQLNLSPVYGEIPAGHYHRYGLTASFMTAFALRGHLPPLASRIITPFCF